MRKLYLLPAILISFLQFSIAGNPNDTIISGIVVRFDYAVSIFPYEWQIPPTSGNGESLDRSEIGRSAMVMHTGLGKYPGELLMNNLATVYVLRTMQFFDVGYGGTNSNDNVYLTNDGIQMGYTDAYIEQTFHHEFSSILYRNHGHLLNREVWDNLSSEGNNDPEAGVGAIRNGTASTEIDTALCRFGFLTQYSLSDFENDLNMLAQNLFSPYPDFWATVDQYPLISIKVDLLIEFYNKLDPMFTESYFRKLESTY